jgi:energy-coupling factor transporter ATP-binding protein EcfA2
MLYFVLHCNKHFITFVAQNLNNKIMANIREINENVLQFLLKWREEKDKDLLFTLRKRPLDRLMSGQWFIGNENYLAFSFWTGADWVNKTQNIYVEIGNTGGFRLRFSAKDDKNKAEILGSAANLLSGFKKSNSGDLWTKEYEGSDYLDILKDFLNDDKKRIDTLLALQRKAGSSAFDKALNPLDPEQFKVSLKEVEKYRKALASPKPLEQKEVKLNLKLREMTVKNTGVFDECTISFGERAICLIGENGGGKTTLLRAIALGLVGTGSPLIDTQAAGLQLLPKIIDVDKDMRLQYAGRGSVSVSYSFNNRVFENGKANLISFNQEADTGRVVFDDDRIEDDGFGLPIGEFAMDGDGVLPILVIGYPQRYGKEDDVVDYKKRSLAPNAYDILPLILNTEDKRIGNLKTWISETWNDVEQRDKVHDLCAVISSILSEEGEEPFIIRIKSAVSDRKIVVTTPLNPNGLPFDLLSTGLNNLFGWIGHLISRLHEAYSTSKKPLHEPAIVLVDEVDNYLHPLVQARTIPILLDTFPNVQFVFTSHSPIILAALNNNGAMAYRIEAGTAIPIEHFYGRTVQDILLDEYGINKRPATAIQNQIDDMSRAIALDNKTEAQAIFNHLLPILGEKDAAIEDAQYDLN